MMNLLANFEQSDISVWVRETPSIFAFPFILYLHTLGLAMLAGISIGLDFWLLGAKSRPPQALLEGVYRIMWLGFEQSTTVRGYWRRCRSCSGSGRSSRAACWLIRTASCSRARASKWMP